MRLCLLFQIYVISSLTRNINAACVVSLLPKMNVSLSPTEVLSAITNPCGYDSHLRPASDDGGPLVVRARIFVFFLKSVKAQNLQFKVHMMLQLRWRDHRLRYDHLSNHSELIGEKRLLEFIWAPHIYFANERDSLVMKGMSNKDHLVSILPEGDVLFTTRMKTTTLCQMKQGKFPFDKQKCHLIMDSWRYNTSNLVLEWEPTAPALIPNNNPSLAEYYLVDMSTLSSEDNCCVQHSAVNPHTYYSYSSLVLTFVLAREFGYYLMDYYLPSVLLVILSWMTFWLEPNSIPTRVSLGTSTMLTFILLSSKPGSRGDLSLLYFRTNDVWFIGCTAFIFLSLVEFAFVNCIHRQELKKIALKKASSRFILKTALSPHTLRRRTSSCPASPEQMRKFANRLTKKNKMSTLSVERFESLDLAIALEDLKKKREKNKKEETESTEEEGYATGSENETSDDSKKSKNNDDFGTVMTTQEIATWVDRKSRKLFPLCFLIFNLFYWTFMFL
ncbi:hypothetical protein LSTR_LSTR012295 [Laodelphax striatellus]|uniref:Neurotransmitter-gated ion-channel ligand-binding domain-containing protein n=1 Tax=Laodelphax striatellus TaxID=195883 RepID=A0A482X8G0_LAOST|nr:hypothetical protein LSTR_LSTR012295 [Laodelphax striatellus]